MQLRDLIREVNSARIVGSSEWERVEITGLTDDSRFVKRGDLFFCRRGGNVDSHQYAKEALKKGAAALVVERELAIDLPQILVDDARAAMSLISVAFYGEPHKKVKLIGITGTNGKTTTAYMLASVLRTAGKSVGIIGTLGIYYANKKIAPELTTPDPIFLQATLADMAACGVEYAVMEVSAHALYFHKDAGVTYEACIFTNCSQDHLDFFKDMEEYAEVKKGLFTARRCALAIVNGDDALGREIVRERKAAGVGKTLVYGLEEPSDDFAVVTEEDLYGTDAVLNVRDELTHVRVSLSGRHNVYNALAAASCAYDLGVPLKEIAAGLKVLKRVNGRLELVAEHRGVKLFVDFAHTPDGLEKSLQALKKHCKGRLVCVFGCGGNRDKSKRPLMGEAVAKNADFAVLTSDNPRYEDPLDIISAIERGYRKHSTQYVIVPERERAVEYAIARAKDGDVLLIAGKGGEEYQEIMGIKYLLNDNDLIKKIIRESEGLA